MRAKLVSLKDSIATRLLKVVFSFYLILAVTVTVAHIAAEYVHTRNLVFQELEILEQTFQPPLEQALWEMNYNQLQSTLTGIMQLPNVVGIEIVNPEGKYLGEMGEVLHLSDLASTNNTDKNQSDSYSSSGLFWKTFQVHHMRGDRSFLVGVVTIYSSRNIVIDKLKFSVIILIVNATIKIIGFWILFLLVSRYLLSRPLAELTRATEQLQLDNLENVKIDVNTKGNNELKILGNAFTGMIQNLLQTRSELYKNKELLEIRVAERTAELKQSRELYKKLYKDTLKTEELYQSLLESTPDAIVTYDLEGKVQYVNSAFVRTFGWTLEEVPDEVPYTPDSEKKATTDILKGAIQTGRPVSDFETQRYTKDGNIIDVSISASPFHDYEGQPGGILVILRDITDRKRWEKTLKIAKEKAERTSQAKSTFLANMSHELRTPLNSILGFSRLMTHEKNLNSGQIKNLEIINRSGEHLLNLINNVLDISKIEAGRVELEESPLDLCQFSQELASLMSARAREKGLDFKLEQSPDLPRHITVDGGKLRQILINLIGNAVKYTAQGGVTVKIDFSPSCRENRRNKAVFRTPSQFNLRFAIIDTGPGIRTEDRERIFAPFVQLENRPSTEAGTGLGLALCRQYTELMGGTILVAGEPGKGSVFHVEIPVTELPSEDIPVETQRGRVIGLTEGQPRYRLLIAEDQPENRLLLRKLLEPLGFDLREAVNGQEAVALFEQWCPDLIWMDIRMPVMNGLEATRQIRKTDAGAQTRIVAVTAHVLEEEGREILAAGCDDFIRKPYRETDIHDALARYLGVHFVYEEEAPSADNRLPLDAADLAGMPAELLKELERALVLIDIGAVNHTIEALRTHHPSLADTLGAMARDLQFGWILRVIRAAASETRPEDGTCIQK
jgi:PAS domain S-box-containing protein